MTKNVLLLTNLYPPQELGGYGRCMSDFAWGLIELGHSIEVLSANEQYLGPVSNGPNGEIVHRQLILKGSFENGVYQITDNVKLEMINKKNFETIRYYLREKKWDAILLGNLDLLGHELISILLEIQIPIIHHIGFMSPPYESIFYPKNKHYKIIAASYAVKESLIKAGFPLEKDSVIYPGARVELFGEKYTNRDLPSPLNKKNKSNERLGSKSNPLKLCFAGLLMGSKGAHTFIEAIIRLKIMGIETFSIIAGSEFDREYKKVLLKRIYESGLNNEILFVGNLSRDKLARMFILNHIGVFASIYPEAFGIVGAEMQASGLALFSTGVGGAKEIVSGNKTGIIFEQSNPDDLARKIFEVSQNQNLLLEIAKNGCEQARAIFDVKNSSKYLENHLFPNSDRNIIDF